MKVTSAPVWRLKIELLGVTPKVWRQLDTFADVTLSRLHDFLQAAMGWDNFHLFSFEIGRGSEISKELRLCDVCDINDSLLYLYDFGDNWLHTVTIEAEIDKPKGRYPQVVAGKNACPPEDCGGTYGYKDLLKTLAGRRCIKRSELLEWLGGPFDPKAFSLTEARERLAEYVNEDVSTPASHGQDTLNDISVKVINMPDPTALVTTGQGVALDFIPPTTGVPLRFFDEYSRRCGLAYNQMFSELVSLFGPEVPYDFDLTHKSTVRLVTLSEISIKGKPYQGPDVQSLFLQIIGRCGARIGAAKKHCQRDLAIMVLEEAKAKHGLDVTPAVAKKAAKSVFKRGLDRLVLNQVFGTRGRTAASKSAIYSDAQQAAMLEHQTQALAALNLIVDNYAQEIRRHNIEQWYAIWQNRRAILHASPELPIQ